MSKHSGDLTLVLQFDVQHHNKTENNRPPFVTESFCYFEVNKRFPKCLKRQSSTGNEKAKPQKS